MNFTAMRILRTKLTYLSWKSRVMSVHTVNLKEAQDTDQDRVSDSQESNDHVPRWCREEFKEQFKAGVSGAHTRKRKKLASSPEVTSTSKT